MIQSEEDRDPVEALAEEYLERQRQGESPDMQEYVDRYPELAEEIRDLFPTITALEKLKVEKSNSLGQRLPHSVPKVERLGDYRLLTEIGRGGMGIVYEAEQLSLGRRVAVKVLPRHALMEKKQLHRFEREARTAARLHHTNIVPVFGVGEQDGLHYYVMQLIRGAGLDAVIAALRHPKPNTVESETTEEPQPTGKDARSRIFSPRQAARALCGGSFPHAASDRSSAPSSQISAASSDPQSNYIQLHPDLAPATDPYREPPSTQTRMKDTPLILTKESFTTGHLGIAYWKSVARLAVQVADALEYAHTQNTLHRDIKPGNLLLDAGGTVWVADFGLAKALESDRVSNTGDIVGTLQYMAPEQFQGQYDHRSDIYSLGLTLYELITLHTAFEDTNRSRLIHKITHQDPVVPRKISSGIPRDLETITLKTIARDPKQRYQSAGELSADLKAFLEDRPIRARRINMFERSWRWCKRNPAVAALTGTVATLLVVVAVLASTGYFRIREALAQTEEQRQRAEATSEVALNALEKIFDQLAPSRIVAASELTVETPDGSEVDIPVQPVLSPDNARLLEELLKVYDQLADQGPDDTKLRYQAAKANRRVGDIRYRLGQTKEAQSAYEQTLIKYKSLLAGNPGDVTMISELASIHNALGQVHAKQRNPDEAQKSYQNAIKLLKATSPSNATSAKIQFELARTYYNLGRNEHSRGFRGKGMKPGMQGGKKKEPGGKKFGEPPKGKKSGRGGKKFGDRPNGKKKEGAGKNSGKLPDGKKKGPKGKKKEPPFGGPKKQPNKGKNQPPLPPWAKDNDAKKYFDQAITILRDLAENHPTVPAYRHLLALSYRDSSHGNWGRKDKSRSEAIVLLRQLAKQYPDVPDYRYELAETLAMTDMPGKFFFKYFGSKYEEENEESLDLLKELVATNPNVPHYLTSLSHVYQKIAFIQRRSERYDEAEQNLQSAANIQTSLIKRFPEAYHYQIWRAKCNGSLAEVQIRKDDWYAANQSLAASIDEMKELIKRDERFRFFYWDLIKAYRSRAKTFTELGDKQLAAECQQLSALHINRMREAADRFRREEEKN